MSLLPEGTGPTSVVCDRLITNGSRSGDLDLQSLARERWRGTPVRRRGWNPARAPRPTVKGIVFYRRAGALGCHTRIREGFPRDRSMARDRPSPYVKGRRFFTAARGPRMPHAHPSGFHRDIERFMKHPRLNANLMLTKSCNFAIIRLNAPKTPK